MRLNSEQNKVWTTLWDESNENIEKKKHLEEFKAHSYRIEVVYNEEGKESVPPTRVYFPYEPAVCQLLYVVLGSIPAFKNTVTYNLHFTPFCIFMNQHEFPEEHKEAINNGITEGSREENLTEFTKWTDSIRHVAKYRVKYLYIVLYSVISSTIHSIRCLKIMNGFIISFMKQGTSV